MSQTTVWATFTGEGFHRWPDAPERRAYLRDRHRHMFHVRAEVLVTRSRQVEFHDLRDEIVHWWQSRDSYFGAASCEDIARRIMDEALAEYTVVEVTVSEDGENGATITTRRR